LGAFIFSPQYNYGNERDFECLSRNILTGELPSAGATAKTSLASSRIAYARGKHLEKNKI
jgi:hypothetical protein